MRKLSKTFITVHEYLLDSLFPRQCLLCNHQGSWLCLNCIKYVSKTKKHVCPECEKRPTPNGESCFDCTKKTPLSGLFVTTSYKDQVIKSLVHHAKYSYIKEIASVLGEIMGTALNKSSLPLPDCIIPIPLHNRRLRWRGFNQSEIIAQAVSAQLVPEIGIPIISDALIKTKNNKPQMSIRSYLQRVANIKNVYQINNPELIRDKRILLIDDIATTGATIIECARLLKENGAREVWGAVVARQEFKSKQ